MSRSATNPSRRLAVVAFAVFLTPGIAAAHEGATGVVAQRMDVMKQMGQHMKALGAMLAGKTAFDGDVPSHVANGRALLIDDYAALSVPARSPSLLAIAECVA